MTPVLGVKIKSGWGATVLLGGPPERPVVLDASRLELSDPAEPATLQPHHAGAGTPQHDDRVLRRLIGLIEGSARAGAERLLATLRASGHAPKRAVLVASSDTDPSRITNPHIRIHALEGQLFRRVSGEALTAAGLSCSTLLERDLAARASARFGRPAPELLAELKGWRPVGGGPWRQEQKMAALGAWVSLGDS